MASTRQSFHVCTIVPPQVLRHVEETGTEEDRVRARRTREKSAQIRQARRERRHPGLMAPQSLASGVVDRAVYDMEHNGNENDLPGKREVRAEGKPETGDAAADEAYDGAGATYDLYQQ